MQTTASNQHIVRYLPLWVYLVTYALTCLLGAMLFYCGYKPILVLLEYFSGITIPSVFSLEQHARLIALFLASPALLALGYWMVVRIKIPGLFATLQRTLNQCDKSAHGWFVALLFFMGISIGIYDLERLGAFSDIRAYPRHFETLGYLGFLNFYFFVPFCAAWLILGLESFRGSGRRVLQWIITGFVLGLTFFMFKKKRLVIACVIYLSCYFILIYRRTAMVRAILRSTSQSEQYSSNWLPILVFCTSAGFGFYDLLRVGALTKLLSWFDYGHWVKARWELFSTLGFFSFVNIYLIAPVSAAWVVLSVQATGTRRHMARCLPIVIVLTLSFCLFQKKALLVALIIIFGAMLVHRLLCEGWRRSLTVFFISGATLLAIAYFFMLLLSVFAQTSKTADEALKPIVEHRHTEPPAPDTGLQQLPQQSMIPPNKQKPRGKATDKTTKKALIKPLTKQGIIQPSVDDLRHGQDKMNNVASNSFVQQNEIQQEKARKVVIEKMEFLFGYNYKLRLLLYSLLAPVTRTSAPALYYPLIFPEHHRFFGLDLGQDILGWGDMPDDNRVVWKYLFPDIPGGSVMAPFQFVLYSQVGIAYTLFLSFLLGGVLGVVWQGVIKRRYANRVWSSLVGSMILLFSIYLAGDGVRSSLMVSYGIMWGCLFIIIAFILSRFSSFLVFRYTGIKFATDSTKP